jgi:predicted transcriptional regulator of viral defense system
LYSKHIADVLKKPVFCVKDLSERGIPPAYARLRLHQMSESGSITRIERGKYSASDNAVLVATHLTEPCYLSLWSAMSARGLTTQIPFSVQVVTPRKRFARKLFFSGSEIKYYHVRPGMMFGYENVPFGDGWRIPLARVEKIIIDAIYTGEIPLGELGWAVESADAGLLKEYSELTGNRRVMNAVKELLKC